MIRSHIIRFHLFCSFLLYFYPYIVILWTKVSGDWRNNTIIVDVDVRPVRQTNNSVSSFWRSSCKVALERAMLLASALNILPSCNCTLYRLEQVSLIYWTLTKTLCNDFIKNGYNQCMNTKINQGFGKYIHFNWRKFLNFDQSRTVYNVINKYQS